MKILRFILGRIILFVDFIVPVDSKKHLKKEEKKHFKELTEKWKIYEFKACPFCVRVRRYLKSRGIFIQTINAKNEQNKEELSSKGGKGKVPCLFYIQDEKEYWLYESKSIMSFIEEKIQNEIK